MCRLEKSSLFQKFKFRILRGQGGPSLALLCCSPSFGVSKMGLFVSQLHAVAGSFQVATKTTPFHTFRKSVLYMGNMVIKLDPDFNLHRVFSVLKVGTCVHTRNVSPQG